jgi:hypothetical protein
MTAAEILAALETKYPLEVAKKLITESMAELYLLHIYPTITRRDSIHDKLQRALDRLTESEKS